MLARLTLVAAWIYSAPALALEEEGSDEPLLELPIDEAELGERTLPLAEQDSGHLRELLRTDFAYTRSLERQLADLDDALRWQRDRAWLEEVEHRLAIASAQHRPAKPEAAGVVYDIPLAEHPLVDAWIQHFTGSGRWVFERWLARAERYMPIMLPILEQKGLPKDTIYLAMIESGFVSHALSRSAASGFWQFMAATGRQFSLRQDTWVDERRDFVRATEKACEYLTQLYREFGDWHLAFAGYNAGGGRIRRAIKRYGVQDFWALIEFKESLSKETQHYVPKIIAAAIVAKNRAYYGFDKVVAQPPLAWDSVSVEDAIELRLVAKQLGVTMEMLRTLNPSLLYDLTPPRRRFELRVPAGTGAALESWLAATPKRERLRYATHVIARGETLGAIARRHGSSVGAIAELNGIKNPRAVRPGQALIVPGRPHSPEGFMVARADRPVRGLPSAAAAPQARRSAPRSGAPERKPVATHVVATGDTLWSIAQRYSVTLEDLRRWNGKRTSKLGVGEVLQIF